MDKVSTGSSILGVELPKAKAMAPFSLRRLISCLMPRSCETTNTTSRCRKQKKTEDSGDSFRTLPHCDGAWLLGVPFPLPELLSSALPPDEQQQTVSRWLPAAAARENDGTTSIHRLGPTRRWDTRGLGRFLVSRKLT